jgi:hypothetical protein
MGLFFGILSFLATASVLFYMGKSGFNWDNKKTDSQDDVY